MTERLLRFGPIRFRAVVRSLTWPLLLGFSVVNQSRVPDAFMVVPLAVSAVLAIRCFRMGLEVDGGHITVRRLGSAVSIEADSLESVEFGPEASPGLPCSLVLRTREGQCVKVRGVSRTRNVIPLASDRDDAMRTVDQFFENAGIGVTRRA